MSYLAFFPPLLGPAPAASPFRLAAPFAPASWDCVTGSSLGISLSHSGASTSCAQEGGRGTEAINDGLLGQTLGNHVCDACAARVAHPSVGGRHQERRKPDAACDLVCVAALQRVALRARQRQASSRAAVLTRCQPHP
jgi:hypothetical protein